MLDSFLMLSFCPSVNNVAVKCHVNLQSLQLVQLQKSSTHFIKKTPSSQKKKSSSLISISLPFLFHCCCPLAFTHFSSFSIELSYWPFTWIWGILCNHYCGLRWRSERPWQQHWRQWPQPLAWGLHLWSWAPCLHLQQSVGFLTIARVCLLWWSHWLIAHGSLKPLLLVSVKEVRDFFSMLSVFENRCLVF